jgi:hypothetical protein
MPHVFTGFLLKEFFVLSESKCLLARNLFAFMGFLGFANIYAMRVNLSGRLPVLLALFCILDIVLPTSVVFLLVAIVAMVNSTALAPNGTEINNDTCPVAPSPSTENSDGPFNWNEQQQVNNRSSIVSYTTTSSQSSVADPGSGAFLPPGSGIRDPGWSNGRIRIRDKQTKFVNSLYIYKNKSDPGSGAFYPPGSGIRIRDGAMVGSGSGILDKTSRIRNTESEHTVLTIFKEKIIVLFR